MTDNTKKGSHKVYIDGRWKEVVDTEITDRGYTQIYDDGTKSREYVKGVDYYDEPGLQPVILADLILGGGYKLATKGITTLADTIKKQPIKKMMEKRKVPSVLQHGTDNLNITKLKYPRSTPQNLNPNAAIYTTPTEELATSFMGLGPRGAIYEVNKRNIIQSANYNKDKVLNFAKPDNDLMVQLSDDIAMITKVGGPEIRQLKDLKHLQKLLQKNKGNSKFYSDYLSETQRNYLENYGYAVTKQTVKITEDGIGAAGKSEKTADVYALLRDVKPSKKLEVDMTDMSNLKVDKVVNLGKIEGPL